MPSIAGPVSQTVRMAPREIPAAAPPIGVIVSHDIKAAPVAVVAEPLAVFSWSTVPSAYPAAASPEGTSASARGAGPSGLVANGGVVTQAFATAGSAVRSALTKVF